VAVEKLSRFQKLTEIVGKENVYIAEPRELFVSGSPLSNRSGNDSREQISTSRPEQDLILITRLEAAIPVIEE
jgi:hypothetical protein